MEEPEQQIDSYGFYLFPIKTNCSIKDAKESLDALLWQTFPNALSNLNMDSRELIDSLMYNLIIAVHANDKEIEDLRNEHI